MMMMTTMTMSVLISGSLIPSSNQQHWEFPRWYFRLPEGSIRQIQMSNQTEPYQREELPTHTFPYYILNIFGPLYCMSFAFVQQKQDLHAGILRWKMCPNLIPVFIAFPEGPDQSGARILHIRLGGRRLATLARPWWWGKGRMGTEPGDEEFPDRSHERLKVCTFSVDILSPLPVL